jgi:hypothetical protein
LPRGSDHYRDKKYLRLEVDDPRYPNFSVGVLDNLNLGPDATYVELPGSWIVETSIPRAEHPRFLISSYGLLGEKIGKPAIDPDERYNGIRFAFASSRLFLRQAAIDSLVTSIRLLDVMDLSDSTRVENILSYEPLPTDSWAS